MPDDAPQKNPPADPAASGPPQPHHVADEPVDDADALDSAVRSPTTDTGLPVEEQIRKEWDPKKDGGLPTGLGAARHTGIAR